MIRSNLVPQDASAPMSDPKALSDNERKLTDLIDKQNALINELHADRDRYKASRAELMHRVDELEHEIETQRKVMQDLRSDKIRSDMFRVLEQYVRDDVDMADIGRTVVAYVDLLDWEACYGTDN